MVDQDQEQKHYTNLMFGEIAIRLGYCTREDIDKVVSLQQQANALGRRFFFGDLLFKQGVLTKEQVAAIIAEQKAVMERQEELLFGRLAVTNTNVGEADIEAALVEQQRIRDEGKDAPRIGDILIKHGKLTPQERDALLKTQKRLRDPKTWLEHLDDQSRPKEH